MTDDNDVSDTDSRRSFVKKGALAAGTLALGASGSATAQTDADGTETTPSDDGEEIDAVVQVSSYHPGGRFTFVSGVVDWTPEVPGVSNDVWTSYNTYMIRWLNTNEIVPLWVEGGATLGGMNEDLGFIPDDQEGDRPELYEMQAGQEDIEDSEDVVQVAIDEVPQEPAEVILEQDDWWQEGNGSATPTEGTDTPGS